MLMSSISTGCLKILPKAVAVFGKSSTVRSYSSVSMPATFKETKEKVTATYGWVSYNLATTAAFGCASYHIGVASKIAEFMETHHPLISLAALLAVSLPPLQATVMIDEKEHPTLKKIALTISNLAIGGGVLSLLGFMGSDVVIPAALITTGVSGSLALAAKNASNEYSLKYKGPLCVGLTGLVATGLCGLAFQGPLGHLAHGISLYGGLFIFSGLLVADVQEMHQRAHESTYSPINQSLFIYLDVLNLFTRITELYHGGMEGKSLPISPSSTESSNTVNPEESDTFTLKDKEKSWKTEEFQAPKFDQESSISNKMSEGEPLRSSESEGFFDGVKEAVSEVGSFLNHIRDYFKD